MVSTEVLEDSFSIAMSEKEIELFLKSIADSKYYLEFGSGGSTFFTLLNSSARIFSIESSSEWIKKLETYPSIRTAQNENRLTFAYANIGEVGDWGVPIDDSQKENYHIYSSGIFQEFEDNSLFDTVLIDGRFRVACTLACIYYCNKDIKIIIHDFTKRPEYYILLKYLDVLEIADTLIVCSIKKDVDFRKLRQDYFNYKYLANDMYEVTEIQKTKAPIAFFVYNRLEHAQKTIAALLDNLYADETEIFIFADGSKNSDNDLKVQQVRDYIRTIKGFKKIHIIEQASNIGLAKSIIMGVSAVVSLFGKVIVVEDDILTSKYFLRFMNDALNMYQDDQDVGCIQAYNFNLQCELPQSFFIRTAECWGWATWRRAWEHFETDGIKLLNSLIMNNLTSEFDYNDSFEFTQMLRDQIEGRNDSWAIRWMASAFLKNKLCLFPARSLVKNIGFDNSGTHAIIEGYTTDITEQAIDLVRIPIEENKTMRNEFAKYYKKLN